MFCTSGGNSASVMSMRFVCNFIFFFPTFYILGGADRLLVSSPGPPPLLPSPLSARLCFPSPRSSVPAPRLLRLSLSPARSRRGISFHFHESFCSSPARPEGAEPRPGGEGRQRQAGRQEQGGHRLEKRSEKEQTRAKFLCCGVAANRRRQGES